MPGSHEAVRREYDALAETYEDRWGWYLEATLEATLARLAPGPRERVLDVGSGTGRLLDRLVSSHEPGRLAGVDVSGGMLGVARGRLDGRILLARAEARALPFPAEAFEHVVSASALHFWRDPLAGLNELARVLAPGGRLVLTDWSRDFLGPAVRELYLRLLDPAHVRTYRERELREMLEEAGLRVLSVERYRIRPTWGMMTAVAEPARDRAAGLSPA